MGWNSYNTYSCSPSEEAIKTSAQGLVDLGLVELGYNSVTVDCGWPSRERDDDGRLQWNETLFPSGGKALGDFVHSLGLGFGLYSGGGCLQCGSEDLPASLGYEEIDAASFAEWGGDSLKYDNCYATSTDEMVDSESEESQSPARFQVMAKFLEDVDRDIAYYICQWGIGENVPEWAKEIGNTWRISNDIYNAWRSIWRITNQVFSHSKHTAAGTFADMDMLIVGLDALSLEEERFHFGMWAIFKSPLIIGASASTEHTSQESLNILANQEVIAINQDPLSKPVQLVRRYTEEEYDILAGELSDDRLIVGIANWKNESQSIDLSLSSVGVQSANSRDVWAASDLGLLDGTEKFELNGHELKLLVLSDILRLNDPPSFSNYFPAADARLQGSAVVETCGDGCQPTGAKVTGIAANSSVTFSPVDSRHGGKKIVVVDYINYDYAFTTAWDLGSNIRNMTVAVNDGEPKRWAFPLSGGDWHEADRMVLEVDGFKRGENELVFSGFPGSGSAPDLVGFEIFE